MSTDLNFLRLKAPKTAWIPAELVFLGAENYELGTKSVKARIDMVEGGFRTQFSEEIYISADEFLGTKYKVATVCDIELQFPALTLSFATMYPGTFPRHYRKGDIIGL